MADPETLAERARDLVLRREQTIARRLLQAHRVMVTRIRARVAALRAITPEDVTADQLADLAEYQAILDLVRREYQRWGALAAEAVQAEQVWAAQHGVSAAESIAVVTAEGVPSFTRLTDLGEHLLVQQVLDTRIPVRAVFHRISQGAPEKVASIITEGLVAGRNSSVVAKDLVDQLGVDATRARMVARTEMLRVYREANRVTWAEHSDVITGWRWLSAQSERTCAACWALDGRIFKLRQRMAAHPNCRCTMIPVTATSKRPVDGPTQFANLDADTQRHVLGPAAYAAYQAGAIQLQDLITLRRSRVWGPTYQVRGLSSVLGTARAARYYQRR